MFQEEIVSDDFFMYLFVFNKIQIFNKYLPKNNMNFSSLNKIYLIVCYYDISFINLMYWLFYTITSILLKNILG